MDKQVGLTQSTLAGEVLERYIFTQTTSFMLADCLALSLFPANLGGKNRG